MKTLVLNGSPHKEGETMTLVGEMRKYLVGQVDIVSAYYDHISPCIDCRFCWEHDGCSIDDAMQSVYANIDRYDNVIIASPMQFSELSGALLSVTSRLQVYWCAKFFRHVQLSKKKKNGILVLTGGGGLGTAKPESTANMIFDHMNAKCIGKLFSLKTNVIHTHDDTAALDQARALAITLNELFAQEQ